MDSTSRRMLIPSFTRSPDVINRGTGWGLEGETFNVLDAARRAFTASPGSISATATWRPISIARERLRTGARLSADYGGNRTALRRQVAHPADERRSRAHLRQAARDARRCRFRNTSCADAPAARSRRSNCAGSKRPMPTPACSTRSSSAAP